MAIGCRIRAAPENTGRGWRCGRGKEGDATLWRNPWRLRRKKRKGRKKMGSRMSICPGCGLMLPDRQMERPRGFHATGECYQKYSERSAYTLSKQDIDFIHQHAVDAYSAQHAGSGMKTITVAFSLIGLYYAVERGYTGKQVQRVHMLLSRRKFDWPPLPVPDKPYSLTVNDVLQEKPGKNRDAMLREWMRDVWLCWEHQQEWIRNLSQSLLK